MALYELLDARRSEVLTYWIAKVQESLAPDASPVELIDHIPTFLDELITCLRRDAGPSAENVALPSAARHGENRLRLGFSLDAVVREYGVFVDAIVATSRTAGMAPAVGELHAVFDFITAGIARAVSEYSAQRDADLRRQTNEHFAFVAHELRNPLSSATAALEIMRLRGVIPIEHPATTTLERALGRTTQLIDESLRMARRASGVDLQRRPTTLAAVCETAQADVLPTATLKGVTLRVSVRQDTLVEFDVRLVRSALGNLLHNAIKHTPPEGTVELRGDVVAGRAIIEVEDGCGGIDIARIEAAFAPFVRLDSQQPGYGLGLAIVRQAVDAHAGSVRVQNVPGKGCVFVMELPIAEPPAAQPSSKAAGQTAAT